MQSNMLALVGSVPAGAYRLGYLMPWSFLALATCAATGNQMSIRLAAM